MPRYLLEISYLGTKYVGWQIQPNGLSVQQVIQEALSKLLHEEVNVIGCGRTDAGVHASQYFLHFDTAEHIDEGRLTKLRYMLPRDIAFISHQELDIEFSARFSATSRSYTYRIHTEKEPFLIGLSTLIHRAEKYDKEIMQACAKMLLEYDDFTSFCKSGSDAKGRACGLTRSEWVFEDQGWSFHITGRRFLRGMVRLVVGMCLQVGQGKMSIEEVRQAMEERTLLPRPLSAPAEGLYLSEVRYDSDEKAQ